MVEGRPPLIDPRLLSQGPAVARRFLSWTRRDAECSAIVLTQACRRIAFTCLIAVATSAGPIAEVKDRLPGAASPLISDARRQSPRDYRGDGFRTTKMRH